MKISVIIPTLNEEKYLPYTLFHAKQMKPYEIIVADCGSKDNTLTIAKKFQAKTIKISKKNPGAARNGGSKISKGDVLLFLDADTIPFLNMLDEIKKAFKKRKTVAWTCPLLAFSPNRKDYSLYEMSNEIVKFMIETMKKPHCPGAVMAIRKNVFEKIGGFDENLKNNEDHDLAIKTKKYGKFVFCKKTCAFNSTRRVNKIGIKNILKKYSVSYLNYKLGKKGNIDYNTIR